MTKWGETVEEWCARVIWHTKEVGILVSLCVNDRTWHYSFVSERAWVNGGVPRRVVRWTPV